MYTGRSKREGRSFAEFVISSQRRLALPWTGLAGLRLVGKTLYDVYESVENQVETALEVGRKWDSDFTGIMDDGIICSESLGMEIKKFDYDFPAVAVHPIKDGKALDRLSVPDPLAGGRMLKNIKAIQILSQNSSKPVAISIEGPFTLAGQITGVEDLARAIISSPEFVIDLLTFTAQVVRQYALSACQAGADLVSIAEPTSIILSEKQFNTFVTPFARSVFDNLKSWKIMHICGDTNHLLGAMLSCGIEGMSLDQVMNIPDIIARIPENIVLFGNIDPLQVMQDLDANGVREKTATLLSTVAQYPNFIMSTGCDCVFETPFDNISTLVDTTHKQSTPPPLQRSENTRSNISTKVPVSRKRMTPESDKHGGSLISEIRQAVITHQRHVCCMLCGQSIDEGLNPFNVVEQGLASGMEEVGSLFEEQIYFIPELLMSAQALYGGLEVLKPYMAMEEVSVRAKLMIGTIEGDVHEIGKNLVIAMFTAAGWEVCDLGADVSTEAFVRGYEANRPDIVGISALMSTTMNKIPNTIKSLRSADPKARIMVGGAPVSPDKAHSFGADGYAGNAIQAVKEGIRLLEEL